MMKLNGINGDKPDRDHTYKVVFQCFRRKG